MLLFICVCLFVFVYLFIDLFIYWFPVALYPSFAHSSTTIGLLTCPVVDTICLRSCVDTICIGAPVWTLFVFAFLWWRFIHHLNFSLHTYDLNIQVVCDFIVSINYCVSRGGGDYYFTIKLLLFSDLETLSSANRDGRFGSKVGQIGPKLDKSGAFSDQISVHLARSQTYHPWYDATA